MKTTIASWILLMIFSWSGFASEEVELKFLPPIDLESELQAVSDQLRDEDFEASLRAAEEEIPVLTGEAKAGPVQSSTYGRLLISFMVVLAVAGALVVVSRRWMTRAQRDDTSVKVRLITQLHFGPKRSVAIVNVAGESLLIGVTDHNISLLRNLSLLDEEVPDSVPRDFSQALGETSPPPQSTMARAKEGDASGDVKMSSVRKLVSERLKQMRPL